MLFGVCCVLFVGWQLFVMCCSLVAVCCLPLRNGCGLLFVFLWFAVCCVMFDVCCLVCAVLFGCCSLRVVCCLWCVACGVRFVG